VARLLERRAHLRMRAKKKRQGRLVVVSNRLPYAFQLGADGRIRAEPASGGLVTALRPVLRDRGGMWIGWGGSSAPARSIATGLATAGEEAGYPLAAVPLSTEQVRKP